MITKRYNLINNSLGWLCFLIAAITYILTLEPTASFWDCPEFILQAMKLEVGHPPGNPIFMLTGRFFVNFAGGDVTKVALMVNTMSALLSAGTILLLFWTVTHLVKKLIVKDDATEITLPQMIAIMGSGMCGALVYTWSDTFWFSAVEGEVYAFSSFCTALVFWLILKWENRADEPHSDRYIILIAYVIGISIGVHLLNLLCIPAVVLVIYYRKYKNTNAKGSLIALAISFVIVALILFGLVPGFIEISQDFEIFFVNTLGMPFNSGVLIYVAILVTTMILCVRELYLQRSSSKIRWTFLLTVILSGIPFIGDSVIVPILLIGGLAFWLFRTKELPIRLLNIAALSILVIFAGYSSYALLLIRSAANPSMNQNAPDNVFSLGSYLNREQYGEAPLLYGQQFASQPVYVVNPNGGADAKINKGHKIYNKVVKTSPDQPDEYVVTGTKDANVWTPKTVFPRMYSRSQNHPAAYLDWIGATQEDLPLREIQQFENEDGTPFEPYGQPYSTQIRYPSFGQNLRYFIVYQLTHMYWRYFMWNFAGRQNDLQGNGEVNRGNWISGFSFIDDARLGDQSLLPDSQGKGNPGHNVFYMMPLLLGLIGFLWQAFYSKRGIEQFWVIFFFFFMTGIAIILYLNQPPSQPRERDYAFAGSFYAFSIWIGIGVAAIWQLLNSFLKPKAPKDATEYEKEQLAAKFDIEKGKISTFAAAIAAIIGLIVPIQMVSQTWDDHDRSGRYAARDFGMNYLASLDPNAVIFTNGDNDTFPLWYAQEVESYRPDVRVVNLSYLTTDWYANRMKMPTDSAAAIDMAATPEAYAYDRLQFNYYDIDSVNKNTPVNALAALSDLYRNSPKNPSDGSFMNYTNVFIPSNIEGAVKSGFISPDKAENAEQALFTDLANDPQSPGERGATLGKILSLDMIATSIKNDWNRPMYFAMTVPDSYYVGLSPYLQSTGLTYMVTPFRSETGETGVDTERTYRNVFEKFQWGGIPEAVAKGKKIYLDETVQRMVTTHRTALLDLATALYNEGIDLLYYDKEANDTVNKALAIEKFNKAYNTLELMNEKIPVQVQEYGIQVGDQVGMLYVHIGQQLKDDTITQQGLNILTDEVMKYAELERYVNSLRRTPWRYATLSRADKYTPTYLTRLIQDYYTAGGDIDVLQAKLEKNGFNVSSIVESGDAIEED